MKKAIVAGVLWLTAISAQAGIDIVKIMSLSCSFCYSAESFDPYLENVAKSKGGKFVYAPVPSFETDTGLKEQVYYAGRDLDKNIGPAIKKSLYKGAIDMGISLNTPVQIYTWLVRDSGIDESVLTSVLNKAEEPAAKQSLARAVGLAVSGNVTSLPTYIILKDGRIAAVVDSSTSTKGSVSSIKDEVISKVKELSN